MADPIAAPRGIVAHFLPFPAVGGTEIATLRVMNAARVHGYESVAFIRHGADPVRRLFEASGYKCVAYAGVEPSYRRPGPFLSQSRWLARELRSRRVNLVHGADVLGGVFAGYAARIARIPAICHVRNRYTELTLRQRSFLLPIRRFVFVSRDTWRHFSLRVPSRRGTVLYDGIQPVAAPGSIEAGAAVRRELGVAPDALLIGMVARVAPQKDYATLAEAARMLAVRVPAARIVIVGDHSSTAALRAHHHAVLADVRRRGVEDSFVFTDFREDVPRFLQAFDIFVLSTHWEGLPLVLLEAMAYGKPVVATRVDGIPELVEHGTTGLLYDHEDADGLTQHLELLVQDAALRETMGRAGRNRVSEKFSVDRFTVNVGRLYDEMIVRGHTGPPADRATGRGVSSAMVHE